MKGFLLLLPLILLVLVFVVSDPLKVIHRYSSPLEIGVLMNDRHFQAEYLLHNKIAYHSFIFGSSRSKMYQTRVWREYINDSMVFHMGVNDESLWGVLKKLEYLDKHHYDIQNCLILLDPRLLRDIKNNDAHIFRDHPAVSGETNIEYYKHFFIAFLTPDFLKAYYNWNRTHHFDESMKQYIWKERFNYDAYTGDIFYTEYDSLIKLNYDKYYSSSVFYHRDSVKIAQSDRPVLTKNTKSYLVSIKNIFDKNHTSYKIIITPNYDQVKFNQGDNEFVSKLFGPKNVTNFSGFNAITNDKHNYYEFKHFLPHIADSTLKIAYQK